MARAAEKLDRGVAHAPLKDARLFRAFAYIGGRWHAARNHELIEVGDPATGDYVGAVPAMGREETVEAIEAAEIAFPAWSSLLPGERARLLRRWFDLIVEARDDLATLMTLEQGKPITESEGEIDYAAGFVEWYAEDAQRVNVESVTSHLAGADMQIRREPAGVAALITPWNFPSAMITRKAAAALAAGCTVVVHPSKETPFSALALAELAERAGLPAGVFNVVTGEPQEIVATLTAHPEVRVVSFTGSTEIGRLIGTQCAATVKQTVMELGGHAPFIVFADADMDRAVASAMSAKFATSGQDCLAANRIYVERSVYEEFVEAFAERTAALKVGNGFDRDSEIGPLMNARAVEKSERHVEDATARGARCVTGGGRHPAGPLFFQPTVLADVPPEALIMREETFGPVAAITPFDGEDEVIARANDSEYGLVAYVHTRDGGRAARMARALQYGMIALNRTKITGAPVPFGGVKQSGLGREGARQGMEAFTEIKYICAEIA